VFSALTLAHLGAQLAEARTLEVVTQSLVMPALAATLWCASAGPRPRLVRLVTIALVFSWLGDSAPFLAEGDTAFLVKVGFFLCAQVAYVAAFWPLRRASVAVRRPSLVVPYGVAFAVLVAVCAAMAGSLLPAVVLYGMCLTTMAVLATGLGRLAGIGGAIFMASDAMIALRAFTPWYQPPVSGFWVMFTYIVGQALLAAAVLGHVRADAAADDAAAVADAVDVDADEAVRGDAAHAVRIIHSSGSPSTSNPNLS
jgi:uncharacterized membrane protein YhhN